MVRRADFYGRLLGFSPIEFGLAVLGTGKYVRDFMRLRRDLAHTESRFAIRSLYPCLPDHRRSAGSASGHYFHQDLYVAQRIHDSQPERHVDVGSRIDGFVAHVAAFRNIEVLDVRPLDAQVRNVSFQQFDLTGDLPESMRGYADSLSCLHVLEHIGLGRYGDRIDALGHVKGLRALRGLLAGSGTLYLSVPIGPQRIEFNAHRVFSLRHLLELVSDFALRRLSCVDDAGLFHEDVVLTEESIERNLGCSYGCAILELVNPPAECPDTATGGE